MIPVNQIGLGLRPAYYADLIHEKPAIDWLEIVSDDFLSVGGMGPLILERLRLDYPMVMHGVGLSLGSADPLCWDYLHALKRLQDQVQPEWVSDHICWTGVDGWSSHDLLPMPRTEKTLAYLASRIHVVQAFLNRPLVLENITAYVDYAGNTLSEWEFMSCLAKKTGCSFLLDVNNLYVNARNRDETLEQALKNCPWEYVAQYHVAGHEETDSGLLLDTHRSSLSESVSALMATCWQHKPAPILLERDDHLPPLSELEQEMQSLKARLKEEDHA